MPQSSPHPTTTPSSEPTAAALSATTRLTAVLDLDLPGPTISRHVYGHFAEHLGRCIYGGFYVGEDSDLPHQDGIRTDVVEAFRALQIPNLRWPGGCFADEYHWRDGVGPRSERPRMVNTHWGDVVEDNSFGTHEFMRLCELLDTDAYVNGNVGSGTVREMSEWVEYLTREGDSPMASLRREHGRDAPWKVPFWGIGNEPWGCGGSMSAQHYAEEARRYATYVRQHGDNEIYRIAAGADSADYTWTETLMKQVGCLTCTDAPKPLFQGISLHYYTILGTWQHKGSATEFDTADYYGTMVKAQRIDELLTRHSSVMDCYDPDRTVGLVLDEWGTWWDVEPGTNPGFLYQQNTLRDALVASLHLDIFHQHAERLFMANIAQAVNVLQAMVLTDGPDLVLTPTYHVFEMNKGHQDAASLPVRLKGDEQWLDVDGTRLRRLSASASVRGGTALVSLSNLDADSELQIDLDLRGRVVTSATGRLLTGELQAHNLPGQPTSIAPTTLEVDLSTRDHGAVATLTLPPHSFATVELGVGSEV